MFRKTNFFDISVLSALLKNLKGELLLWILFLTKLMKF